MKRLLISLVALLALACPAWGAAELENQFATKTTPQTFTSTSFADYMTLTIDRSGEGAAQDFIYMVMVSIDVTVTGDRPAVQFRYDTTSTVLWLHDDGLDILTDSATKTGGGHTYTFGGVVNITNAAGQTFSIEVARESGTGNVDALQGKIILFEKTSEMAVHERTTEFATGSSEVYETAMDHSFTSVGRTVDYLLVFFARINNTDESDSDTNMSKLVRDDNDDQTYDETYADEFEANLLTPANDNKNYSSMFVATTNLPSTTATHIQWRLDGNNTGNQAIMEQGCIMAIPTDLFQDFEFATTAVEFEARGSASPEWEDDPTLTLSTGFAAAPIVVLYGTEVANESGSHIPRWRIDVDGTPHSESRWLDDRSGATDRYLSGAMYAEDFTSPGAPTTIKMQGSSSGTTGASEGLFESRWLAVFQVAGTPPGEAARRRQNVVIGGAR